MVRHDVGTREYRVGPDESPILGEARADDVVIVVILRRRSGRVVVTLGALGRRRCGRGPVVPHLDRLQYQSRIGGCPGDCRSSPLVQFGEVKAVVERDDRHRRRRRLACPTVFEGARAGVS